MRIARLHRPRRGPISLTPMVDVLMILLIFFMVTSTYLDLDMLVLSQTSEDPAIDNEAATTLPGTGSTLGSGALRMVLRLGVDGQVYHRGTIVPEGSLAARIADQHGEVILVPSARAPVQGLVRVMEAAASANAGRLRVIRLGAQ